MQINQKVAHTQMPWTYHLGRGTTPRFHIQGKGGYQIASTTELERHPQAYEENAMREANAEFIIRAVNNHEELLTIAKAYRNLLKTMAHTDGEVATYHHINDVLAKAEGK